MRTGPTARDHLAAAHARMTPAEIAAHALELIDLIAAREEVIASSAAALGSCAAAALRQNSLIRTMQTSVRQVVSLHASGRKRQAREMLAEMAGMEMFPLVDVAIPEVTPLNISALIPDVAEDTP